MRKTVTQLTCSRCPRVETIAADAPPRGVRVYTGAVASGDSSTAKPAILFEDLCTNCWSAVNAALTQVAKKLEKESPDRSASREEKMKAATDKKPPEVKEAQKALLAGLPPGATLLKKAGG